MKKKTAEALTEARLEVPVGLGEAEQLLAKFFPRWAFTYSQLRSMCMIRSIPYYDLPCAGPVRTHRFLVRVADVVKHLAAQEMPAL